MEEKYILDQIKDLSSQISFQSDNFDGDLSNSSLVLEDKNKDPHILLPIESLNALLENLASLREENLELKLERAIWKYVPIDFADTWTVVMSELEDKKRHNEVLDDTNLNKIVKDVKKKHPNLFLNLDDLLPSEIRQVGQ